MVWAKHNITIPGVRSAGLGLIIDKSASSWGVEGGEAFVKVPVEGFRDMGAAVSPSEAAGVRPGDLVERVNGSVARSAEELALVLQYTRGDVVLMVQRKVEAGGASHAPARAERSLPPSGGPLVGKPEEDTRDGPRDWKVDVL